MLLFSWRWSYAKKRSRAEKTRVVLKQIDCFSRYRISKGDYRDSSLWQIQSDEVNGLSFERKWSGSGTDYTDSDLLRKIIMFFADNIGNNR